jgi:hypothetical protein
VLQSERVSTPALSSGTPGYTNPITGIADCCALVASGHAAAAPPSAASNSRRPTATVIRPSRVSCVNGTIPRHKRAVFTFKEGKMLEFARRLTRPPLLRVTAGAFEGLF